MTEKTFSVALTIPDNEAFTARETLRRMGLPVADVQRADIWTFEVDDAAAATLAATVATMETMFNPNKHRLQERANAAPHIGEVWIGPRDETPATAIGGRAIPGVGAIRRCTAWRLLDERGADVAADVLERATSEFLCNPAFQKARR
jgi:phosphoribosylformylglycinamidine (FGAM) synthase PurS component